MSRQVMARREASRYICIYINTILLPGSSGVGCASWQLPVRVTQTTPLRSESCGVPTPRRRQGKSTRPIPLGPGVGAQSGVAWAWVHSCLHCAVLMRSCWISTSAWGSVRRKFLGLDRCSIWTCVVVGQHQETAARLLVRPSLFRPGGKHRQDRQAGIGTYLARWVRGFSEATGADR